MINEQVLLCGSGSPVAQGQADIYRGARAAGRPSKKRPHFREPVRAFWEFKHTPPVAALEVFSGSRSCVNSRYCYFPSTSTMSTLPLIWYVSGGGKLVHKRIVILIFYDSELIHKCREPFVSVFTTCQVLTTQACCPILTVFSDLNNSFVQCYQIMKLIARAQVVINLSFPFMHEKWETT